MQAAVFSLPPSFIILTLLLHAHTLRGFQQLITRCLWVCRKAFCTLNNLPEQVAFLLWNTVVLFNHRVLQMAIDTRQCTSILPSSIYTDDDLNQKCHIWIYHNRFFCSNPVLESFCIPILFIWPDSFSFVLCLFKVFTFLFSKYLTLYQDILF